MPGEEKNKQQERMGDTATEDQGDVAEFMKAESVTKKIENASSGEFPKTKGIKTPGSPRL